MSKAKAFVATALVLLTFQTRVAFATGLALFTVETEAQQHCPSDTVVWANTPTGVYHFKGMRWYGNTNHGAYVCKKEGDEAGYRATRNGQ
jgi:hypothetical protein